MKINICRQDPCSTHGVLPLWHFYAFSFELRCRNTEINRRRAPTVSFQSTPDKRFNFAERFGSSVAFSKLRFVHFVVGKTDSARSHSATLNAKRNFYPISMFVLVQLLIQILTLFLNN